MATILDALEALHDFASTPQVSGPLGAWGMWLAALGLAGWLFWINWRHGDPVLRVIAVLIALGTIRFVLVSLGVWP